MKVGKHRANARLHRKRPTEVATPASTTPAPADSNAGGQTQAQDEPVTSGAGS